MEKLPFMIHGMSITDQAAKDNVGVGQRLRFMKTLKVEDIYLAGYEAFSEVAERLPTFIEQVYNSRRLHSALGYRSPEEFETQFGQQAA